jgi:hypothetical protein
LTVTFWNTGVLKVQHLDGIAVEAPNGVSKLLCVHGRPNPDCVSAMKKELARTMSVEQSDSCTADRFIDSRVTDWWNLAEALGKRRKFATDRKLLNKNVQFRHLFLIYCTSF